MKTVVGRRMPLFAGLLLALAMLLPGVLHAHELLPGYLELSETGPGQYEVLWKLPLQQGNRLPIAPRFPEGCRQQGALGSERSRTAWIYRATLRCTPPLAGQPVVIDGLEAVGPDVLVRFQPAAGNQETHLLKPEQPTVVLGSP